MLDYSLGLMVRIARCLHQEVALGCNGRTTRRMGMLVTLWTAPPTARNTNRCGCCCRSGNCAVHEPLQRPKPPSLRRLLTHREHAMYVERKERPIDRAQPDAGCKLRSIAFTGLSLRSSLSGLRLATVGTGNARRLCPLDTNLAQRSNSPGTEELLR